MKSTIEEPCALIAPARFCEGCNTNFRKVKNSFAERGVHLLDISPEYANAYIERFNFTYRNEVLDCYLFNSLTEVREITDSWMVEYNYERPHESLNDLPPKIYERLNKESSI